MPRVVLLEPFVRHYAGTVFDLEEATYPSSWDEHALLREKQSFNDKMVYLLPDAGNGRKEELPLYYTELCPEGIFNYVDIKSGPCRITSVSPDLIDYSLDSAYEHIKPVGKGKVRIQGNDYPESNSIILLSADKNKPFSVSIYNLNNNSLLLKYDAHSVVLDFSNFLPGFYLVKLEGLFDETQQFTLFKNFPYAFIFDKNTNVFNATKTIW